MAFVYAGDRATSSPAQHLAGYRGVLQTDGYSAYKALAKAVERCANLERSLIFSDAPQGPALGEELIAVARAARRR